MPAELKRIDFEDIQVGDTIRIVDVLDIKITDVRGHEVAGEGGHVILDSAMRHGVTRKFQLIKRINKLPEIAGSIVTMAEGGGTWILVYEVIEGKSVWINTHNGARQSPSFAQQRANDRGGFEVIR